MNRRTVERNPIFEENSEVYCTWLSVLQYNKILYNLQSEQQHPTSKKSMVVYKTPVQFTVTSTTPTVPRVQRQHIRICSIIRVDLVYVRTSTDWRDRVRPYVELTYGTRTGGQR